MNQSHPVADSPHKSGDLWALPSPPIFLFFQIQLPQVFLIDLLLHQYYRSQYPNGYGLGDKPNMGLIIRRVDG